MISLSPHPFANTSAQKEIVSRSLRWRAKPCRNARNGLRKKNLSNLLAMPFLIPPGPGCVMINEYHGRGSSRRAAQLLLVFLI